MSLLIDALKKAEQIKKNPPIWQQEKILTSPSSPNLSDETFDTLTSDDENKETNNHETLEKLEKLATNQPDEKDEPNELSPALATEKDFLMTKNLNVETTQSANEPSLEEFDVSIDNASLFQDIDVEQIEKIKKTEKTENIADWENEFLPEFQAELADLETNQFTSNNPTNQAPEQTNTPQLDDSDDEFLPEFREHLKDFALHESTSKTLEATPSTNETDKAQNELTQPTEPTTAIPNFDLVPIEGVSHETKPTLLSEKEKIEEKGEEREEREETRSKITETEKLTPPNKHQAAQRILAATTQSPNSKRQFILLGILGLLLISMGGGYYYMQSIINQPSKLQFGQLSQRLKNNELSNNAQLTEINNNTSVTHNETIETTSPNAVAVEPTKPVPVTPPPTTKQILASKEPETQPTVANEKETEKDNEKEPEAQPPVDNNQSAPTTVLGSMQKFMSEVSQTMKVVQTNQTEKVEKTEQPTEQPTKQPPTSTTKPENPKQQSANSPLPDSTNNPMRTVKKANREQSSNKHQNQSTITSPQLSQKNTAAGIRTLQTKKVTPAHRALTNGYQAWQQGNIPAAKRAYLNALQQEPKNKDALLGLAAIAAYQGQRQQAQHHYRQVLQLYPQDTMAQLGLINSLDNLSPANETQLKLLKEKSPDSAPIHFSLGNLYARQGRWTQAQQAYFQAYRHDKQQADYAYNLAISLEQLNQPAVALTYYQQALQLTHTSPTIHFNPQIVQKRIRTLQTRTRTGALARLPTQ